MPTLWYKAVNSNNYSDSSNWFLDSNWTNPYNQAPTENDSLIFKNGAGNCIIDSDSCIALSLFCDNYDGIIIFNGNLTVRGDVTLCSGMSVTSDDPMSRRLILLNNTNSYRNFHIKFFGIVMPITMRMYSTNNQYVTNRIYLYENITIEGSVEFVSFLYYTTCYYHYYTITSNGMYTDGYCFVIGADGAKIVIVGGSILTEGPTFSNYAGKHDMTINPSNSDVNIIKLALSGDVITYLPGNYNLITTNAALSFSNIVDVDLKGIEVKNVTISFYYNRSARIKLISDLVCSNQCYFASVNPHSIRTSVLNGPGKLIIKGSINSYFINRDYREYTEGDARVILTGSWAINMTWTGDQIQQYFAVPIEIKTPGVINGRLLLSDGFLVGSGSLTIEAPQTSSFPIQVYSFNRPYSIDINSNNVTMSIFHVEQDTSVFLSGSHNCMIKNFYLDHNSNVFLSAGFTYPISSSFFCDGTRQNSVIRSTAPGTKSSLVIYPKCDTNVCGTNFIDIDASGGKTIFSRLGQSINSDNICSTYKAYPMFELFSNGYLSDQSENKYRVVFSTGSSENIGFRTTEIGPAFRFSDNQGFVSASFPSNSLFNGFAAMFAINPYNESSMTTRSIVGFILNKASSINYYKGFGISLTTSSSISAFIDSSSVLADVLQNIISTNTNSIEYGKWQHVCLNVYGSGEAEIYLNGNLSAYRYNEPYTQSAISARYLDSTNSIFIGRFSNINYGLDGFISDLKIYNVPLTKEEIYCEYEKFSAKLHSRNPINEFIKLYDKFSVNEKGLVAYWPMNSPDVVDICGINHGTGVDVVNVNGLIGSALYFNGYNSCIVFDGVLESLSIDDKDFTICAWIKTSSSGTIISKTEETGNNAGYILYINDSGLLSVHLKNNEGNYIDVFGNRTIIDNTWHFVSFCLHREKNKIFLYIDGVLDQEYSDPVIGVSTFFSSPIYSFIGCKLDDLTLTRTKFFSGIIDDIFIYKNQALTHQEIYSKYKEVVSTRIFYEDFSDDGADGMYKEPRGWSFGSTRVAISSSNNEQKYAVFSSSGYIVLNDVDLVDYTKFGYIKYNYFSSASNSWNNINGYIQDATGYLSYDPVKKQLLFFGSTRDRIRNIEIYIDKPE